MRIVQSLRGIEHRELEPTRERDLVVNGAGVDQGLGDRQILDVRVGQGPRHRVAVHAPVVRELDRPVHVGPDHLERATGVLNYRETVGQLAGVQCHARGRSDLYLVDVLQVEAGQVDRARAVHDRDHAAHVPGETVERVRAVTDRDPGRVREVVPVGLEHLDAELGRALLVGHRELVDQVEGGRVYQVAVGVVGQRLKHRRVG